MLTAVPSRSFGLAADYQRAKWGDCIDADKRCREWAGEGECENNPAFMNQACRKACNKCHPDA